MGFQKKEEVTSTACEVPLPLYSKSNENEKGREKIHKEKKK